MFKKRVWACLFGGAISAVLCMSGRQIIFGFPPITWDELAAMVANRLLLGFAIGISGWRIHYLLHGALMGLIFSLSASIGFLPDEQLPFFLYTTAWILYGVLIEWLASDIFKAPMKAA
jgi:hypothetical protein